MNPPSNAVTFAALVLMLVLSGLDQTILSTALPTIVQALDGRDLAAWVFSAYLLASTAVIPLYGKLADRVGVRPLLLLASALFGLGSLACAAATGMPALVAARALQGMGGGGLMTLAMLAAAALYPLPERGRRMGLLGAAYSLSTLVGPLLGGLMLQTLSWQWAFLINLPGTLAALVVFARAPLGAPGDQRAPLDVAGAALLAALLVTILLSTRGEADVGAVHALSSGLAGVWALPLLALVLLAWWWRIERRAADPVVPLDLFRHAPFAAISGVAALSGVALFAAVVFVPIVLQQGLGLSALQSALTTLPLMLGITVGGQLAGRTVRTGGSTRRLARLATLAWTSGFLALAVALYCTPAHGAAAVIASVAAALLPVGIGLGLLFPIVTVVAQRSAAPARMGVATSTPVMMRALGGALGVAGLAVVLRDRMATDTARHLQAMPALADGVAQIAGWAALAGALAWALSRWLPGATPVPLQPPHCLP